MDLENLQTKLERTLNRHHVVGASIAVYYEGRLSKACAGFINVNTGVKITPDTVMHIGSIAKIFTTTLIMQLVDEGYLVLDNPVLQYLPELKIRDTDALKQITVKMLLNHTSGIDGDVQPDCGHDEETIDKAVKRFANIGQIHKPGTESSYCNGGMVIAGYMAQQLTGTSWYDLIKEKIYAPLDMQHSVTLPEEAMLHRASVGHFYDSKTGNQIRTSFSMLPMGFSPSGTTLMMSAQDLVTFARAHMSNGVGPNGTRILSDYSTNLMKEQTVSCQKKGFAKGIGLGWMLYENGVMGHSGGAPGVASQLYICPDKEFAAAILTNSEHGALVIKEFMATWLESIVGGITIYNTPSIPSLPKRELKTDPDKYVGIYENVMLQYKVSVLSDGLGVSIRFKSAVYDSCKTEFSREIPLIPLENHEFCLKPTEEESSSLIMAPGSQVYTFKNPNSDGKMQHITAFGGRLFRRVS